MITNERQYRITGAQLEKLRKAINDFDVEAVTKRTKSRILAKAELEAFSKYGLTNITDKYLPQKLELAKSL